MKARILLLFLSALTLNGIAATSTPALIPLPQSMQVNPGTFTLCPTLPTNGAPMRVTTRIQADAASLPTAQYLATLLARSTGYLFTVSTNTATNAIKGSILLTTSNANTTLGTEGYELTVAPDSVVVRAPFAAGVFYGVQTLLQLLPPQIVGEHPAAGVAWTAPCVFISDQPRFSWRGMMLDCARHFYTKQEVKTFLDALAFHKINTFHWHLVDDQGWRIEILKYPNLTSVGAWRNGIDYGLNPRASSATNSAGQYGGYYTQSDIREVVAYAAARHITIVPEIEMPGHSSAGLASYPQYGCSPPPFNLDTINYHVDVYSPGLTNTFGFLDDILTEVIGLFPSHYIHCGGDEVATSIWTTNTVDMNQMIALGIDPNSSSAVMLYQSWFSAQIANFLASQGRTMIGWSEIEYGGVLTNAAVMDWITGSGSEAVNAATNGQPAVMTPQTSCYYNEYQSTNYAVEPLGQSGYVSLSNAYVFEPIPTNLPPQYTSNILGAQGNLWGEYLPGITNGTFRAFPRMCAMAELTWTPAAQKNYTNFLQRLTTHEQRLSQMGINYDRENLTQIGAWAPTNITASAANYTYNITTNLSGSGEVDVSFYYLSGQDGLYIYSATLLENGVQLDADVHRGFTGASQTIPIYILHLPQWKSGATYTLQISMAGRGGTDSTGTIYLPNWN